MKNNLKAKELEMSLYKLETDTETRPSLAYPISEPVVEDENQPIEIAVETILNEIGEDPDREGLLKTPNRVARMFGELTAGYNTDPVELVNGAIFSAEYDDLVLVKDIDYFSLCEHHMLPFYGKAHVAYIPDGKVIGLSKIPRIVEMFARRLQIQEQMTAQIAHFLAEVIEPKGVAVVLEGVHMCARMRGVKNPSSKMTTRTFLGEFKTNDQLRKEFLDSLPKGSSEI
jgi:GTP cyclohydrolase I